MAVLWGVITAVFFLFNLLPGDVSKLLLGQQSNEETAKAIKKDLGLDKPLYQQYFLYLNDVSPISIHNNKKESSLFLDVNKYQILVSVKVINGNSIAIKSPYLRRSYQSKKPISEIVAETLPSTALLAFTSILMASLLGILLGIIAMIFRDTFIDRGILFFSALGVAGPSFFVAIIVAWIFGFLLGDITGLPMTGSLYVIDDFGEGKTLALKNIILPTLTLGIRPLAIVSQLTRSSLADVMLQDYIRTAKAKGLTKWQVIYRHALKNALTPVITAISGWFASLLAGAVFVEYIFGWKGIGKEIVDALENYDLPVVMGVVIVIACIFVVINLLLDLVYGILDPRVRV